MTACKSNPGETGLAIKQQENSWCRPASRPVTWTGILIAIGFSAIAALGLYAATVALLIDPYILKGSEAGRVIGASKIVRDITSKRQAEERERLLLAEAVTANAKFRAFFEQGALFAGIMDVDGTVIEPNPNCRPIAACTGGPCFPSEANVPAPPPSIATNSRGAACLSRSTCRSISSIQTATL